MEVWCFQSFYSLADFNPALYNHGYAFFYQSMAFYEQKREPDLTVP